MSSPIHEYELTIVERHLDTFGHVNNATYLDLFEEARWDWITRNDYGLERIRELKQGPTILEVRLRFKREILNRQRIKIASFIQSYEGKVAKLVQQMRSDQDEICCEADFLMGLFDLESRRLILPTAAWKRALGID